MNSNRRFSLPAADSIITKESLLNKVANKQLVEEQVRSELKRESMIAGVFSNFLSLIIIIIIIGLYFTQDKNTYPMLQLFTV